ncbi:TonB-dependent receptor [Thalassotalea sediminis]|uniref:TonB-dependent receptor n=1 Tax=Thalassotalea sediminis TaxID=1759089 RepID=UPI0025743C4A|nr:TonB-dependent receptor [Thalassotalea sediminis]
MKTLNQLTKSLVMAFPLVLLTPYNATADDIEQIVVLGERTTERIAVVETEVQHADISDNLRLIAGANVNKNGSLTGIVQYRGLYGDRVATQVGGQHIIGAGPNAMDTPLSYSPAIITDSITMQRGIASVTSGIESLGGSINTTLKQAHFSETTHALLSGDVRIGYQENGESKNTAGLINLSTNKAALMAYIDTRMAEHLTAADGRVITPTGYTKTQSGFSGAVRFNDATLGVNYHYNDTHEAGTPSLPMDIDFIYTHRTQLYGKHALAKGELSWQLGFIDADHKMDNFQQRMNMMPTMHRSNHAQSETTSFTIDWKNNAWTLGFDGYQSTHDATITNPNNMMFNIANFNNIKDKKISLFGEYQQHYLAHTVTLGARVKRISAKADNVSHHMAMMNPTIKELVTSFNQGDRHQNDTNTDLTLDWLLPKIHNTQLLISIAQKQRAPSYQERYLWLPMEATAGLADGNTYLGNVNLESETANQINIGTTYQTDNFMFVGDIFYTRINDYIQGMPNMNMPVNMLAKMMMNSDTVLQFSNVDAQLSGFDGQLVYQLGEYWQLSTTVSYVRGKRKDIDDNLYRVAPLNGHLALSYQGDGWQVTTRLHAFASQDNVATLNHEKSTAGYGYIDIVGDYQLANQLSLNFGVKNLTNREYQDHLSAYNRVNGSDISPMSRIPSTERSVWLTATLSF